MKGTKNDRHTYAYVCHKIAYKIGMSWCQETYSLQIIKYVRISSYMHKFAGHLTLKQKHWNMRATDAITTTINKTLGDPGDGI